MKRILTALALCILAAAPVRAQSSAAEQQAVLAVTQKLFDAMRVKDTAAMRQVFAPDAKLFGMRTRRDGTSVLQVLPWSDFAAFNARDNRGEWLERAWNPEVRIDDTLATVWAEYDFHLGGKASHCGTDAVQLLKTSEGWKIVSLADTYKPSGCPARPAP